MKRLFTIAVPGAPPTAVAAVPLSASNLNVTWSDIAAQQRYGIVLSYKVKYGRTDGKGVQKEIVVNEKSSKLEGLPANVEYEISVAGMTIKGVGVFSPKITITTKEDGKEDYSNILLAYNPSLLKLSQILAHLDQAEFLTKFGVELQM